MSEHDPKEAGPKGLKTTETAETGVLMKGIKKVVGWVRSAFRKIIGTTEEPPHHAAEKHHGHSPERHVRLSPDLLLKLKSQTKKVSTDVASLIERGAVADETDKKLLGEAATFIQNPTEKLEDIMSHTSNIGQVLSGYEMQGADAPDEIYAMNSYLVALQCINQIDFVETALEQGSSDAEKIQYALASALDWATILSRGWSKDDSLLTAVHELEGRVKKQ